jgi:hypothetical protein
MLTNLVKRIGMLFLLITATSVGVAAAHGEGMHVFGTITTLDDAQMAVLTIEGKMVSVHTLSATKYRNRGRGGGTNFPKVGDRVAVDVTEEDGKLMATEVQFSSFAKKQAR